MPATTKLCTFWKIKFNSHSVNAKQTHSKFQCAILPFSNIFDRKIVFQVFFFVVVSCVCVFLLIQMSKPKLDFCLTCRSTCATHMYLIDLESRNSIMHHMHLHIHDVHRAFIKYCIVQQIYLKWARRLLMLFRCGHIHWFSINFTDFARRWEIASKIFIDLHNHASCFYWSVFRWWRRRRHWYTGFAFAAYLYEAFWNVVLSINFLLCIAFHTNWNKLMCT